MKFTHFNLIIIKQIILKLFINLYIVIKLKLNSYNNDP